MFPAETNFSSCAIRPNAIGKQHERIQGNNLLLNFNPETSRDWDCDKATTAKVLEFDGAQ
jgi:hypothetical protein